LVAKYGDKIMVNGYCAKGKTGVFDVAVDGITVHVKANNGFVDTTEKVNKICEAIDRKLFTK
jgi:hypothetical protein